MCAAPALSSLALYDNPLEELPDLGAGAPRLEASLVQNTALALSEESRTRRSSASPTAVQDNAVVHIDALALGSGFNFLRNPLHADTLARVPAELCARGS